MEIINTESVNSTTVSGRITSDDVQASVRKLILDGIKLSPSPTSEGFTPSPLTPEQVAGADVQVTFAFNMNKDKGDEITITGATFKAVIPNA